MAAVNYILVVLGFCALFFNSSAQLRCTSVLYGVESSYPIPLSTVYLYPGVPRKHVTIVPGCDAAGVRVIACDDVPPAVQVPDVTDAYIERLGSLSVIGTVTGIAYCISSHTLKISSKLSPVASVPELLDGIDK